VDGCAIYRDDRDRFAFLERIADVVERFKWQLYAYCLMTNHYHLVLRTPWPTLSRGVQRLNGMHAQRFNQRHRRTGHLFGARFDSPRLKTDAHLLLACRYTVRNPVRANLCGNAAAWRWSSFNATAGLTPRPPFLAVDELLPLFGPTEPAARRTYLTFVEQPLGTERLAA
jgi:REP element-mobilizing transposase RayT